MDTLLTPDSSGSVPGSLLAMLNLILAAEEIASSGAAGDSFATLSYIALGLVMLIAAIATVIVTPSTESQH